MAEGSDNSQDRLINPFQPSRALIANDDAGIGFVLAYIGFDLDIQIENLSFLLSDLGLDDAPTGLSIWDGVYCPIYTDSDDYAPEGSFRRLTPDEWQALQEGRPLWDEAEWNLPEGHCAECGLPPRTEDPPMRTFGPWGMETQPQCICPSLTISK